MSINRSDFPSVSARAMELGTELPAGLVILPSNFDHAENGEALLFPKEALTVTKLLGAAGIPVSKLGGERSPAGYIHNRDASWIAPMIFIGAEIAKNPDVITVTLSLIQEYLVEMFRGTKGDQTVAADVVIEYGKSGKCRKISYSGDVSGLKDFAKIVASANKK